MALQRSLLVAVAASCFIACAAAQVNEKTVLRVSRRELFNNFGDLGVGPLSPPGNVNPPGTDPTTDVTVLNGLPAFLQQLVRAIMVLLSQLGVVNAMVLPLSCNLAIQLLRLVGTMLGSETRVDPYIFQLNSIVIQLGTNDPRMRTLLDFIGRKLGVLIRCLLDAVRGLLAGLINPNNGLGGGGGGGGNNGIVGGLVGDLLGSGRYL